MVAQAIRERASEGEAADHVTHKGRCYFVIALLVPSSTTATSSSGHGGGMGMEKRVGRDETRRETEETRGSCFIARKSIKAGKGCHEQRDPRCRPGAAAAPVPTELLVQVGFLPAVNLDHQRGWHMKRYLGRYIYSGPPFLTAAVSWRHVSQSAATPEWQARHFDVQNKTG